MHTFQRLCQREELTVLALCGLGLVISAPEAVLHPRPSWLSELESWRPKWEEQLPCDQLVDQMEGQWWRQCEEWFWLPLVSQGLPVTL